MSIYEIELDPLIIKRYHETVLPANIFQSLDVPSLIERVQTRQSGLQPKMLMRLNLACSEKARNFVIANHCMHAIWKEKSRRSR
jgi:hypothetical protein